MKKMKKIIRVMLVILMICCVMPFNKISASTYVVDDSGEYAADVEKDWHSYALLSKDFKKYYKPGETVEFDFLVTSGHHCSTVNSILFEFQLYYGNQYLDSLTYSEKLVTYTVANNTSRKDYYKNKVYTFDTTGLPAGKYSMVVLSAWQCMSTSVNGWIPKCNPIESANQQVFDFYIKEPVPTTPTLTVTAQDYQTFKLSWTSSSNAKYYEIYTKKTTESSYQYVGAITGTSTSIEGFETGKEYSFYVKAVNDYGSASSNVETEKTSLEGTPTLSMSKVSDSKFKLSWTKIKGATRYIVYRKRNDDKMKKVLTLNGSTLTYTTAEMPHGDYEFVVKAARYDGKDRVMTNGSNKKTGTVSKRNPKISLTAGSKQIKISWSEIEGVTNYEIYRSNSKNGTYNKIKTTTSTSYTDKSLTKGKTYYYKVKGYKLYKSGTDLKYNVYTSYSDVKSATAK